MYRTLGADEKATRKTTVTLLIDAPLRERLERMAAASERSLGAEARVAIRDHIERNDEEEERHAVSG